MNYLNVGKGNSGPIELYYEDYGSGRPVVLIHGWPLSGRSWEKQVPALLDAGFRVIAYDRRGFGWSSRPSTGYDYDTLAGDLNALMTKLDLREAALVGFSMGGGEVARYLGAHGSKRVSQAVFMSAITPYLLKGSDNPDGVDRGVFDGILKALAADRPAYLSKFLAEFYNADLPSERAGEEIVRLSWNIAAGASPLATRDCVTAWRTDFRGDLAKIDVPVAVIHGDADRITPLEATGRRTHEAIAGSKLAIIAGGPHGLNWTHAEEVNRELLTFLGSSKVTAAAGGPRRHSRR